MMDRSFTVEELEAVRKWREDCWGRDDKAMDAIDALLARNPPPKPKMRPTKEAVERWRAVKDPFMGALQAAADAGLLADEWLEPVDG